MLHNRVFCKQNLSILTVYKKIKNRLGIRKNRRLIPRDTISVNTARLRENFEYDFQRFCDSSSAISGPTSRKQWQAVLTVEYHKIEKALALPNPRPGFGMGWIPSFLERLDEYIRTYGDDQITNICLTTIKDYINFQNRHSQIIPNVPENLAIRIGALEQLTKSTRLIRREDILKNSSLNFEKFAKSRCSVRHFMDKKIPRVMIDQAIEIASHSPSVCNRQAWYVYAYDDRGTINKALSFQRGNSGFGHQIPVLLIITADLASMHDAVERYQPWIDGGLFSMSLIYALHSLGISTCCLNLSICANDDRRLRMSHNIRDEHSLVMMLAAGYPPDEFPVTRSARKAMSELVEWNRKCTAS